MIRRILAASLLLLMVSLVYAAKPAYIGSKKCKTCHWGASHGNLYEKWAKAPHAKAFETLKAKGEEKNPQCLGCHTTGYKDGGYDPGAANAKDFEGVQCESCHGKGSLYRNSSVMKDLGKSIEKGLILPMESLCIKCHNKNSPTFKGFDYDKYVNKITHKKT